MERKTYTVLMTSNRLGETKSITVSAPWLKTAMAIGSFICILLLALLIDYFGLLLQSNENKRLSAENLSLKKQFEVVESKVESLESSLERVKSFSTKLKLITNIDDDDRSTKLSVGPMPKVGQGIDEYNKMSGDRMPSGEFLQKESRFLDNAPLEPTGSEDGHDHSEGTELSGPSDSPSRSYASLSIRIDQAVKKTQLREQGVLELWETLSERQALLNATPSIKPARGWFTSKFGYRIDPFTGRPAMHAGLDIAASPGTPVMAPANGVVSYVGFEPGYGKIVTIDHGYGVKTRFAHNSQVFVEVGQKVKRYDPIAAVGNTGRSTGPHLHYEVRVHDVPVDPMNYVLSD
jgi:murein DD-endopeptidase MepM/ murein hydrolase activator NlpD